MLAGPCPPADAARRRAGPGGGLLEDEAKLLAPDYGLALLGDRARKGAFPTDLCRCRIRFLSRSGYRGFGTSRR
jgi:hypothetical protein